jgi:hypothetical protein
MTVPSTVISPDLRKKSNNKRREREAFYLVAKITETIITN